MPDEITSACGDAAAAEQSLARIAAGRRAFRHRHPGDDLPQTPRSGW